MLDRLRVLFQKVFATEVPPHSYALLRMVLGAIGVMSIISITPIDTFWSLDGLAPLPATGIRAWLAQHDLGTLAGRALFISLLASFGGMVIGFRSDLAVLASFLGQIAVVHWNSLPLSSAHQVMTVLLFCLVWAETGQVWSVDAWLKGATATRAQPVWPLWLMRCQVAIIYLSTGLHKLAYPTWRDGTAVHWALNLNGFHRFPWPLPVQLAPVEAFLTWGTLLFELGFWLFVLFRRTRPWALVAGVGLHLGLFATLELASFSYLMLASYICYLAPETIQKLFRSADKR